MDVRQQLLNISTLLELPPRILSEPHSTWRGVLDNIDAIINFNNIARACIEWHEDAVHVDKLSLACLGLHSSQRLMGLRCRSIRKAVQFVAN